MTIEKFPAYKCFRCKFSITLEDGWFRIVRCIGSCFSTYSSSSSSGGGGRHVNTAIARCYALSSRSVLLVTSPRNAGMESLAYAVGEAAFKIPNAWGVSRTITGFVFMMNYSLIALEHLLGGKEVVI